MLWIFFLFRDGQSLHPAQTSHMFNKLNMKQCPTQTCSHEEAFRAVLLQICVCYPQILLCPEKNILNIQHKKILALLKIYFSPKNLIHGYGSREPDWKTETLRRWLSAFPSNTSNLICSFQLAKFPDVCQTYQI